MPYDDGTAHVVLSPMEFIGRLAALLPKPLLNLTPFHGVFPPHSKRRDYVVPQHPVEEQENPKPKAYSRPSRIRMGAATHACIRHRNREMREVREVQEVWWSRPDHCIYRGPRCYSEDPEAPGAGSARGSTEPLTA